MNRLIVFIALATMVATIAAKNGMWTTNLLPDTYGHGLSMKVANVTTTPTQIKFQMMKKSTTGAVISKTLTRLTGVSIQFPLSTTTFLLDDVILIDKMVELGFLVIMRNGATIQILDDDNFVGFDAAVLYFDTNLTQ